MAVTPNSGTQGTTVDIIGKHLLAHGENLTAVSLAGVAAVIVEQSDFSVTVTAQPGSDTTGDVQMVANTGATITKPKGFTYLKRVEIEKVSPAQGQAGTIVELTGVALLLGADKLAQVTLAGVWAKVVSESDTKVVVRVNPTENSNAVLGDVRIT